MPNSNDICRKCDYPWSEHIQGRCPPRVLQDQESVAWFFGIAILVIALLAFRACT